MPHRVSRTFQARRALLRHLAPRYQQASPAQKTLLLDSFVEWTGYTRKYAIELLNHGEHGQQTIERRRLPQYRLPVQQALFLAWKATHSEEGPAQAGHQEGSVSCDEILNWPRTTHDPFVGAWEEVLALVQVHPDWNSTQILQEIGYQTPERAVSAPIETLMHGLGTIHPHLRANWEEPWPPELIQGGHSKPLPTEPHLIEEEVAAADQHSAQAQPMHVPAPGTSSSTTGEHEAGHLALTTLEQAMAAYLQEMRACGPG